jgi:hypothetical protein
MINRRLISIFGVSFAILLLSKFVLSSEEDDSIKASVSIPEKTTEAVKPLSTKDTVFVIHFHPTVQCSCCINVGNFSKKGLEKFYANPYKEGRIVFKECNIDEDTLTAKKYQIFWSALGFRKISKGKNDFIEIESVWEFCEDEDKFLHNFKTELDQFLREDKEGEDSTTTKNKKTIP